MDILKNVYACFNNQFSKWFDLILRVSFLLFISGCINIDKPPGKVVVDFSETDSIGKIPLKNKDEKETISIAVSAIVSPRESFIFYEKLIDYIGKKINYHIKIKQRKTYGEINQMLIDKDVDMAFICSGAYTKVKDKKLVDLLVVPVCNGQPYYQAYIITNKYSNINTFKDLKGRSFAFTDPLSNTGKLYAEKRLKDFNSSDEVFFSSTMFTHAHDVSIQLVAKNVVDAATVDGLIFEYLAKFYPERVKNIKIIEKSDFFGIPPVVVPSSLPKELQNKLKLVFLNLHRDSLGKEILNNLLIDRFIEGDDKNYNSVRKMQNLD